MRDFTQRELEANRPNLEPVDAVEFVLRRFYADRRYGVTDEVVSGLTFEELIGALLLARDELRTANAD